MFRPGKILQRWMEVLVVIYKDAPGVGQVATLLTIQQIHMKMLYWQSAESHKNFTLILKASSKRLAC